MLTIVLELTEHEFIDLLESYQTHSFFSFHFFQNKFYM